MKINQLRLEERPDWMEARDMEKALGAALDAMAHYSSDEDSMELLAKMHMAAKIESAEAFKRYEREQQEIRAKSEKEA